MRSNKVKDLWRQSKKAAIAWMSLADPYAAEIMANVGFDALVLDMQHGMGIGPDRAASWLQAVSTTDTVPLVRVAWNEPHLIQWVLDAGAYGVIVPLVNNKEETEKAVGATRYPPLGYRSLGPNRARFYAGADYLEKANDEIICLVMVEDIRTVDHLEEMATVPGIDGFYIGPADLAISLGKSPSNYLEDDEHAKACQKVLDISKANGLVPGVHCSSLNEALQRFEQGFQICPVATDAGSLASMGTTAIQATKS